MAVDTRDKRANCLNVAAPWMFSAPNPDGAITSAADRQHIAFTYRGIAASGGSSFQPAWAVFATTVWNYGGPAS